MSGPKVSKQVSRTVKTTTRYEFTHAELCKRLRLPEGAFLFAAASNGNGETFNISNIESRLVAEVTSESSK